MVRAILVVSAVLAGAGIVSEESALAAAYSVQLTVPDANGDVTITISQNDNVLHHGTQADVDKIKTYLNTEITGSAAFKNKVVAAGQKHTNAISILTYRDSPNVVGGKVAPNIDGSCCSKIMSIDMGDIDVFPNHLDAKVGTPQDRTLVGDNWLHETLIHEMNHVANVEDPQLYENTILPDLGLNYQRTSYWGYCRVDTGDVIIDFTVASTRTVSFNESTYYPVASAAGLLDPPSCGVGGIAELPEISNSPQNMPSEKSKDHALPIAEGVAAAVAAVAATGALYIRRNRSAK